MQQSEDEQERLLSGEWVPLPIPTAEGDKADSEAMEKVADKRTGKLLLGLWSDYAWFIPVKIFVMI